MTRGGAPLRAAGSPPGATGFTLVELLIAVVVASVLGATTVNLFRVQTGVFRSENQSLEVEQNLRAGLDHMLRELRNAGMQDPLHAYAAAPGIVRADSQAIRFTADVHGTTPGGTPDGDVMDPNEDVEYTYTPADRTLRRKTRGGAGDSGAQPMAELVSGVRFTYVDAAGALLPLPIAGVALGEIRRIRIELRGAPLGRGRATSLESDVAPRNLAF